MLDLTQNDLRRVTAMSSPGTGGCLLFVGYLNRGGYGVVSVGGRTALAHRVALAASLGIPLPDPKTKVLHSCDVRNCVNPDHLRFGTQTENILDMESKGRAIHPSGDRIKTPKFMAARKQVRGEGNPKAKLTAADVIAVRARAAAGEDQSAMAREFGVHPVTIAAAINRKTWKHL